MKREIIRIVYVYISKSSYYKKIFKTTLEKSDKVIDSFVSLKLQRSNEIVLAFLPIFFVRGFDQCLVTRFFSFFFLFELTDDAAWSTMTPLCLRRPRRRLFLSVGLVVPLIQNICTRIAMILQEMIFAEGCRWNGCGYAVLAAVYHCDSSIVACCSNLSGSPLTVLPIRLTLVTGQ